MSHYESAQEAIADWMTIAPEFRTDSRLYEMLPLVVRLREKLIMIHQITQDTNAPAWDKVDNIAATAMCALFPDGFPNDENAVNKAHALGIQE